MTRCDFGLILGFLALLTMFSPLLIARWESRRARRLPSAKLLDSPLTSLAAAAS
jgi:hypothetical protein